MRTITAAFAARALALSTLTALALACEDAVSPGGAIVPPNDIHSAERVPTRREMGALLLGPRYWADGYAWSSNTTTPLYSPSPEHSYNRTGGAITIAKPAGTTGRYIVTFSGLSAWLGTKSTVHVTTER